MRNYWKIELTGLVNYIMTTQMPNFHHNSIEIYTGLGVLMILIDVDFVQRISRGDGTGLKTIWEAER